MLPVPGLSTSFRTPCSQDGASAGTVFHVKQTEQQATRPSPFMCARTAVAPAQPLARPCVPLQMSGPGVIRSDIAQDSGPTKPYGHGHPDVGPQRGSGRHRPPFGRTSPSAAAPFRNSWPPVSGPGGIRHADHARGSHPSGLASARFSGPAPSRHRLRHPAEPAMSQQRRGRRLPTARRCFT